MEGELHVRSLLVVEPSTVTSTVLVHVVILGLYVSGEVMGDGSLGLTMLDGCYGGLWMDKVERRWLQMAWWGGGERRAASKAEIFDPVGDLQKSKVTLHAYILSFS